MARRSVALLVTLGLLAVGCGGEQSADADLLAERVDRVAALVDAGRDCDAATAAVVAGELAAVADVSDEVRQEVVAFARAATTHLGCDPAPAPTPSDTPTDAPADPDDDDDDDEKGEHERRKGRENRGKGQDKGKDDDDD